MGSTHFFVEKSYFREVVEFETEKFDSQQHLMEEAPDVSPKWYSENGIVGRSWFQKRFVQQSHEKL